MPPMPRSIWQVSSFSSSVAVFMWGEHKLYPHEKVKPQGVSVEAA